MDSTLKIDDQYPSRFMCSSFVRIMIANKILNLQYLGHVNTMVNTYKRYIFISTVEKIEVLPTQSAKYIKPPFSENFNDSGFSKATSLNTSINLANLRAPTDGMKL